MEATRGTLLKLSGRQLLMMMLLIGFLDLSTIDNHVLRRTTKNNLNQHH